MDDLSAEPNPADPAAYACPTAPCPGCGQENPPCVLVCDPYEAGEVTAPKRIQRKRTKGWRMPEGALYVGRGTPWGNPWRIERLSAHEYVGINPDGSENGDGWGGRNFAAGWAVDCYTEALRIFGPPNDEFWGRIEGRDLACWCPLDQPCHADVLLELANSPAPYEALKRTHFPKESNE